MPTVAAPPGSLTELFGRVMGTELHVLGLGADAAALDGVRRRLEALEARWSRFRPDSEVSRLNHGTGEPVAVSPDTRLLVRRAVQAWHDTLGRFDPTVLPAMEAAGYDRTFTALTPPDASAPAATDGVGPSRGLAGVVVDDRDGTVRLPSGTRFDPGAIGKGLAADLAATEAVADGTVDGILVNVGGDLRVAGEAPHPGWGITLDEPEGALVGLAAGALATSTIGRRRWQRADGTTAHHVIDPATGAPATTAARTVTVVAGEAWRAETLATALLLDGDDAADLVAVRGGTGLIIGHDGVVTELHGMEAYRW
jgi:thiamine biosynthesis lipoprotein